MNDGTFVLNAAYVLTEILDKVLDTTILLVMIAVFAIGGRSLWYQKEVEDVASATHYASIKPAPAPVIESGAEVEVVPEESGPTFEDLMAINPDVIAWLTIPDTGVDHPVVQTTNNTLYVNTDIYGQFSMSGTPFLDRNNTPGFTDAYSIIYGHHLSGGVLFGALDAFLDPEYLASHSTGELMLKERTIHVTWLACVETDAYDGTFMAPLQVMDQTTESAVISASNGRYQGGGRLLALSTCGEKDTNARTLLIGRIED